MKMIIGRVLFMLGSLCAIFLVASGPSYKDQPLILIAAGEAAFILCAAGWYLGRRKKMTMSLAAGEEFEIAGEGGQYLRIVFDGRWFRGYSNTHQIDIRANTNLGVRVAAIPVRRT